MFIIGFIIVFAFITLMAIGVIHSDKKNLKRMYSLLDEFQESDYPNADSKEGFKKHYMKELIGLKAKIIGKASKEQALDILNSL